MRQRFGKLLAVLAAGLTLSSASSLAAAKKISSMLASEFKAEVVAAHKKSDWPQLETLLTRADPYQFTAGLEGLLLNRDILIPEDRLISISGALSSYRLNDWILRYLTPSDHPARYRVIHYLLLTIDSFDASYLSTAIFADKSLNDRHDIRLLALSRSTSTRVEEIVKLYFFTKPTSDDPRYFWLALWNVETSYSFSFVAEAVTKALKARGDLNEPIWLALKEASEEKDLLVRRKILRDANEMMKNGRCKAVLATSKESKP